MRTQRTHSLINEALRLELVPDQGGRIDDLVDRRTGKNWLWHPDGYEPSDRLLPVGASFDENWRGGWEEVFPNDAPGPFASYALVDHGELWSQPWKTVEASPRGIKMAYSCQRVPVDVEKTVVLEKDDASFRLHYLFRSRGFRPLPFLFKLHPAIAIEPGDEILLPRSTMIEPVALDFSTLIGREGRTTFPSAFGRSGERIEVHQIPPREANGQEFFYATELSEGWAGIRNPRTNTELKIRFDLEQVPYVWAFQSYGKWRNHYTLVLEPCTNVPWDVPEAMKQGTCAMLEPGEHLEFHFDVSIDLNES